MTTFARPGVYATEVPLPAVTPPTGSSRSIGAMFGKAMEGPTDPTFVSAWGQFVKLFNVSDVQTSFERGVYQAFANGATGMYVCRVTGSASTKAAVPTGQQTAVPFLVTAKTAGSWGNSVGITYTPTITSVGAVGGGVTNKALTSNVATLTTTSAHGLAVGDYVTVAAVDAVFNGTFRVASVPTATTFTYAKTNANVTSASATGTVTKVTVTWSVTASRASTSGVYYTESFTVVTTDPDSARYYANVINDVSAGSAWLTATTVVPTAPVAEVTVTALSGGADAPPGGTDYTDAVERFDLVEGALLMHCPDAAYLGSSTAASINAAMTNYCTDRGNSFAILDTVAGLDATGASEFGTVTSSYAAMYYPWIRVSNPSRSAVSGASLLVPPGAAVAGIILGNDRATGPWQSPAGTSISVTGTVSNGALGVERLLTAADLDLLNTAARPVNPIRPVAGQGITIMGARTQAPTAVDRYIQVRRTLNLIKEDLTAQSEFALFSPITTDLMQNLTESLSNYLDDLWLAGGLAGATSTEGFYVICDSSNNTAADAAQGRLNIDVGVALLIPAEYIVLRVGQFQGATTVAEIA